jgi:hypothetical protein
MKQLENRGRSVWAGLAVLPVIAGLVALAIASLAVSTGTAQAQEAGDIICVDGADTEVTEETAGQIADGTLVEGEDFTTGACEAEPAGEGVAVGDTVCLDGADTEVTQEMAGQIEAGTLVEGEDFTAGACATGGAEGGPSAVPDDGTDEGATGDEAGDDAAGDDAAGDDAAGDDTSDDEASEDVFVPDPNPNLFPGGFNTTQQQQPLPAIEVTQDEEAASDAVAGATEEVSALPSSGSGGLAGGGPAPWGAMVAAVLLSLGGAAALITRSQS